MEGGLCEDMENMPTYNIRREALEGTNSVNILISDFYSPKL